MNWRLLFSLTAVVLVVVLLAAGGVYFGLISRQSTPNAGKPFATPTLIKVSPSPTLSTQPPPTATKRPITNSDISLLDELPRWAPDIQWQDTEPATTSVEGKTISGVSRTGTGISADTLVPRYTTIDEELIKRGWKEDPGLAGGGPGSSVSGYVKTEGRRRGTILLDYQTKSRIFSAPGEPIQFEKCPCPYELTVTIF